MKKTSWRGRFDNKFGHKEIVSWICCSSDGYWKLTWSKEMEA